MVCCGSCVGLVVVLFVVYKLLDYLMRKLRINKLDQRYILVTGCDTGFGNLLCKRLDRLGCHVFAGCFTDSGLQELTKSCSVRMHAFKLDVSKPESVKEAYDLVKASLPEGKGLWALMNNAGLMGNMGPPEYQSMSDYRFVANVNLFGLIDMTNTFLPLIKQERGRVVSTASVVGRVSPATSIPYNVTKYGVEAFMDGLRRAMYPFKVKCSLIEPGIHNTTFWTQTSTTETMKRTVTKDWNELPESVREEYGKEYHDYISKGMISGINKFGSTRFEDVVDAYEHAILARYPRARYLIGLDARTLFRILMYTPESFADWFLRVLEKDYPTPAAAKKL